MKRILIIEDDPAIAHLIRDYLEAYTFEAVVEHNGEDGLRRALLGGFDLIILDLMLPGKDGFEICRELRLHTEIPILMVTARQEEIDVIRGLGLGADDYIIKPFSPSTLVARVRAHLERYERVKGRPDATKALQIRNLRLLLESRQVFIGEQEVQLTAKEFELLSLMAKNPNRVFSREELFERVWGMDSLGDSGTVTVHIKNLREKIEADPTKPLMVETVWGVGYRLRV
jgi:DNA-binding response OmpR family regulator